MKLRFDAGKREVPALHNRKADTISGMLREHLVFQREQS
jgi:hypothetical protein